MYKAQGQSRPLELLIWLMAILWTPKILLPRPINAVFADA